MKIGFGPVHARPSGVRAGVHAERAAGGADHPDEVGDCGLDETGRQFVRAPTLRYSMPPMGHGTGSEPSSCTQPGPERCFGLPRPIRLMSGRAAYGSAIHLQDALSDRWASHSPLLVVYVASMSEPHDDHHEHVVLDGVDDPVVADPDTKTRPTLQRACPRGSRILGEQRDCALDPAANLRVELAQGADCRRAKLDAIRAHSQPRSALTCSQGMFGPSSAIAASKAATSSASSRAVINCS